LNGRRNYADLAVVALAVELYYISFPDPEVLTTISMDQLAVM